MEKFWKSALGVAGLGAIGFFVFFALYKQWLSLGIFSRLDKEQTFIVMVIFLLLTFLALICGVAAWLVSSKGPRSEEAALHNLENAWKDVNYIQCENLIGPDVNKAGNALHMTALYWRKRYIDKSTLAERYGLPFCELFEQLQSCDKEVPGYTSPKKKCADFLPALVRATYAELNPLVARRS